MSRIYDSGDSKRRATRRFEVLGAAARGIWLAPDGEAYLLDPHEEHQDILESDQYINPDLLPPEALKLRKLYEAGQDIEDRTVLHRFKVLDELTKFGWVRILLAPDQLFVAIEGYRWSDLLRGINYVQKNFRQIRNDRLIGWQLSVGGKQKYFKHAELPEIFARVEDESEKEKGLRPRHQWD